MQQQHICVNNKKFECDVEFCVSISTYHAGFATDLERVGISKKPFPPMIIIKPLANFNFPFFYASVHCNTYEKTSGLHRDVV